MKIDKLIPTCKDYIWGGSRLAECYNKVSSSDIIAESWELSAHPDGVSMLSCGVALNQLDAVEHLGSLCESFGTLPVLVKLIHARHNLSVQVHPSDDYALQHEHSFGKTEMWYIVDADEGAGIYLGLKCDMTTAQIQQAISDNTLLEYLNFIPVTAGGHYWIDSGTVHAIGKGCIICEIQQSSNITYRVYDYDRVDNEGNKRPLHIQQALDVMDSCAYTDKSISVNVAGGRLIGKCQYFSTYCYTVSDSIELVASSDSFVCVVCTSGSGSIDGIAISQGDSYFVPANYGNFVVSGGLDIIVVTL